MDVETVALTWEAERDLLADFYNEMKGYLEKENCQYYCPSCCSWCFEYDGHSTGCVAVSLIERYERLRYGEVRHGR